MVDDDKDQKFAGRIQSGIATVEAWDDDPSLLAECRLMIPFAQLMPELHGQTTTTTTTTNNNNNNNNETTSEETNPYARDDDFLYQGNALFLKRLALYFQKDVMTWVNAPPCVTCASTESMEHQETRGPQSQEEHEGQASRVEVYLCKSCGGDITTTFPRYNSVRKLLETRQGRCGEYANLFGLYCRAAGYETRYVLDWTDHVWVEALVGDDEWIMADSCEGKINEPSMYESGWGKKLNYMVGVQVAGGVVDVTPRYTRQFYSAEFQERRRQITTSEAASDQIVSRYNERIRQGLPQKKKDDLARRGRLEQAQLDKCKSTTEWTDAEKRGRGRISGSLEWRIQRNEAGNNDKGRKEESSSVRAFHVEQFYPAGPVGISVFPKQEAGILVSGANCDIGQPHCISVVVIDDVHLGCILQCRSFALWNDLATFLQTIPLGRIVALKGATKEEAFSEPLAKQMDVLAGFKLPEKPSDGVVFLGRLAVGVYPEWTGCASYKECKPSGFHVEFPDNIRSETTLRAERGTVPQHVVGRLPEATMPLQTQLLASEAQKRIAFLSFAKNNPKIVGYTTKDSSPVYLIDNSSFPMSGTQGEWATFHFLPEVLVPQDDDGVNNGDRPPKFDVPLEEGFFTSLLGPTLLVKSGRSGTVTLPTADALRHTRLVGLYFSGHWCGPCRQFTPMLSEAYAHLKESFVYHGLEIVFVSSDRSNAEFNQYFGSMPWTSVSYDDTRMRQQGISMRYGVRGIPALVVLDSISGQVVASIEQSRKEVAQACNRGDNGIEDMFQTWLSRVPDESRELFNLLELSSAEVDDDDAVKSTQRNAYLTRTGGVENPWSKPEDTPPIKNLDFGVTTNGRNSLVARPKEAEAKVVLQTILKYLDNCVREPWNPKFRQFKLSNKIVDKALRVEGSLDLICSFGMMVVPTTEDFMISIPLGLDLDRIHSSMTKALKDWN